jgi:hypothetical protein
MRIGSGTDFKPTVKTNFGWMNNSQLFYFGTLSQICIVVKCCAGFPKFKSKHGKQSVHYPQT